MNRHQEARPTLILVAIDDTPASVLAVDTGAALAGRLGRVELHLVHVVAPSLPLGGLEAVPDPTFRELHKQGRELLAATRASLPALPITTHCVVGTPALEVVRVAKELDADIVVVGSHNRRSVERWLLGSISELIVRKAGCAVVVARPKDHGNAEAPEIEPPCQDCVAVQKATDGDELWCERHSERHVRAHLHYETPPTFGVGSNLIRPAG